MTDISGDGIGQPASGWYDVTPDDTDPLPIRPRGLYVASAGVIRAESPHGEIVDFPVGDLSYHPLRPYRIHSTGTTATGIVALY